MSQAKVERYKEEKANRKQTMKKEKITRIVRNSVAAVVVVAVLGWVGYSGVTYIIDNQPRPEVEVDYTAVSDYETALAAVDTEDTTDNGDDATADTADDTATDEADTTETAE